MSGLSNASLTGNGFVLDVSGLDASYFGGEGSVWAQDRSAGRPITILIIEHERCIYCRHDVAVEERCANCGALPGDRR